MKKNVKGAWIIHHTQKLQTVENAANQYQEINFAGKCGILLSAISSTQQTIIERSRLNALANAANINLRFELPIILEELEKQRLIERGEKGIEALGLTTGSTLEHTSRIFEEKEPDGKESASIELSEKSSELPLKKEDAKEFIADKFSLKEIEVKNLLDQYEQIGFVDIESIGKSQLYFNGNLFRKEDINKINGVLSSLSSADEQKANQLNQTLASLGCIAIREAKKIVGDELFKKLSSVGFFDVNSIYNEQGKFYFVTKPGSFSKFTNTVADDAFDNAKALVTSLTYGMLTSPSSRGRIRMIETLMRKLINGYSVGPATAIGQDYKTLELKGVIKVTPAQDSNQFFMQLLKKDVGELALSVIMEGEASQGVLGLPSASLINYSGPETNREIIRKKQNPALQESIAALLDDLRTGMVK